MAQEIGSEFWDIPTTTKLNNMFPKTIEWFLSGRSALQAIINKLKDCHTVAMPCWCCDSMVKPFVDAGMEVQFYPVFFQKKGITQDLDLSCDVLFLMDYFGYAGKEPDLGGYNGLIVRDITHSIFSKYYTDADYYFGSLRKWCGVWTGGFAWAKDNRKLILENNNNSASAYVSLRQKAMELKECYINEKLDRFGKRVTDKGFLSIFNQAEELLENIGTIGADKRDIVLAEKLDVNFIRTRRRSNAKVLMQAFADYLIFPTLNENDCPLFVPILVPDGKRNPLRQYLIQHEIYCPIHWPVSEYHKLDSKTVKIYDNELSLVCDQRYTEEDMQRIVDTIKMFWKEN